MINDLYPVGQILKKIGVSEGGWCRSYKELPKVTVKAPCVRLWIGESGIISFEEISPDQASGIRKYGSNQGTFPAMNLRSLYRITDEKQKKRLHLFRQHPEQIDIDEIRSWCTENNWTKKFHQKVRQSLSVVPQKMLTLLENENGIAKEELAELISWLPEEMTEAELQQWHKNLEQLVFQKLEQKIDVALSLSILLYVGSTEKNHEEDSGTLSVVLDNENFKAEKYEYPIAHAYFTKKLNQLLGAAEKKELDQKEKSAVDAFQTAFAPLDIPMPNVKLPGFEVTLHTMFKGQPCQDRYGNFEREVTAAYPLAPENRNVLKRALEWLAEPDQEGRTWLKTGAKEILFVYPSYIVDTVPGMACIFGRTRSAKREEEEYRVRAGLFTKELNQLKLKKAPPYIQIFVIRKLDKARTKLMLTRNTMPKQLEEAVQRWQEGCQNLPDMLYRNNKIFTPFPLDMAGILNPVWRMDGQPVLGGTVEVMQSWEGVSFFLDPRTDDSRRLLHSLLEHTVGLGLYISDHRLRARHYGDVSKQKEALEEALSLIALFLYICDCRKEQYMTNFPYLLGQLLKISDELHAMYCEIVRKGDIPPSLAGSALYAMAAETPQKALALLGERMSPYTTWANSYKRKRIENPEEDPVKEKEKRNRKRAGWCMKLYRQTATQLCENPISPDQKRLNDFEKAQLFLGYLAEFPQREKSEDHAPAIEVTDETIEKEDI